MQNKIGAMVISVLLTATTASCGFKSDLYLPGQQQKIEQYDSRALEDLGNDKLRELQNQSGISDDERHPGVSIGDNSTGALPVIPDDGVVVDIPKEEEIEEEKAQIRKKVTL